MPARCCRHGSASPSRSWRGRRAARAARTLARGHSEGDSAVPARPPARAALSIARGQAAQLGRRVDDLLEVSRITRGMIALRLAPMGLGSAVHEAAESVAPAIEARRQSFVVSVPSRPLHIVADAARIAQVLENLLHNASKFTPEGGTIRVEAEVCGDEVELRVVDDGVGIAPGQLGAIFDLFAQADPAPDRAQGGLGIGLALVRRLVALHGGWVGAASAGLGRGSTFTVRLPRAGPVG
jgi:signal transduction histidine kinase